MCSSDKEMSKIEQLYEDKTFGLFLGSILTGLLIGLIIGPFLALKLFPSYFCFCG